MGTDRLLLCRIERDIAAVVYYRYEQSQILVILTNDLISFTSSTMQEAATAGCCGTSNRCGLLARPVKSLRGLDRFHSADVGVRHTEQ